MITVVNYITQWLLYKHDKITFLLPVVVVTQWDGDYCSGLIRSIKSKRFDTDTHCLIFRGSAGWGRAGAGGEGKWF